MSDHDRYEPVPAHLRPAPPPESEYETQERTLLAALAAWGRAIRLRYPFCDGKAECGGSCCLMPGHRGGCLCDGVEGGEERCPA